MSKHWPLWGAQLPITAPWGPGPPRSVPCVPWPVLGARLALAVPPACPLSQQGLPHAHLDPQIALLSTFAFRVRREKHSPDPLPRWREEAGAHGRSSPSRQSIGVQGQHSPSQSARTWGSRAGLPWCEECQGATLGVEGSPLSSPPVPLPGLWDRFASEVLSLSEAGMCCWAGLCPTPGHCGCPPTCPHGGSLEGFCCLQLQEDAQRVSPRGPLCGFRMMSRWSSGRTLLWLQENAHRVTCRDPTAYGSRRILSPGSAPLPCTAVPFPGCLEMSVTSATGAKCVTKRCQSRAAPG